MGIKLPKSIKIGGVTYNIVEHKQAFIAGNDIYIGLNDRDNGRIHVCTSNCPDQVTNTLLHESIHGLWNHFNFPRENEEDMVIKLTEGFLMLMRDNPKLAELVCQRKC